MSTLLYAGTTPDFIQTTTHNAIADRLAEAFEAHYRYAPSHGEFQSWQNSLRSFSDVLRARELGHSEALPPPPAPAAVAQAPQDQAAAKLQDLASEFRQKDGRRVSGALPVHIPFVAFGPSIFLASELTPETRAATLDLEYERRKGS